MARIDAHAANRIDLAGVVMFLHGVAFPGSGTAGLLGELEDVFAGAAVRLDRSDEGYDVAPRDPVDGSVVCRVARCPRLREHRRSCGKVRDKPQVNPRGLLLRACHIDGDGACGGRKLCRGHTRAEVTVGGSDAPSPVSGEPRLARERFARTIAVAWDQKHRGKNERDLPEGSGGGHCPYCPSSPVRTSAGCGSASLDASSSRSPNCSLRLTFVEIAARVRGTISACSSR